MTLYEPLDERPIASDGANFSRNALNEIDLNAAAPGWFGFTGRLAFGFALVDLAAIAIAFFAGALLADGLRGMLGVGSIDALTFLMGRADKLALLALFGVGIFAFGGLYRRSSWETDEVRGVVCGVALIGLMDATFQFALNDHASRLWFLTAYPLAAGAVLSARMAVRALPALREAMTSHVILLGSGVAPDLLIYELRESCAGPVKLLRSVPLSKVVGRDPETVRQLIDRLARHADVPSHRLSIVVAPAADEIGQAQNMVGLLHAAGKSASLVLPFTGLARNGVGLRKVVGADMVMAELQAPRPDFGARVGKRLFDILASGLIVALLAPVFAILIALMTFEKGPVFFRQLRVGRDGRKFLCYKFRSMRPDAEERLEELLANDPKARLEWARDQKLKNDPRITPIGDFLRRTSLDELPQIFNVLKGDMSLVGPRPIIAPEVAGYDSDRAYYQSSDFEYYSQCTPGITGLWQVSGRSSTKHEERVRLDRWYARNWSFWLDLMILLKTVRVVMMRSGSV